MDGPDCKTAAMAVPLLQTSGPVNCEAMIHSCGTSLACLFYDIATVCQLYRGIDMMYVMTRRKPESTLLLILGIFNLQHDVDMV